MKARTRCTLFLTMIILLAGSAASTASPASASGGAQVPSKTGSSIPQAQAQAALDFHNAKRQAVGVAPLEWSANLAAVAQNWADHLAKDNHCNLSHSQNNTYGENLFVGPGKPYAALAAAQDWYSEIARFQYGVLTNSNWSLAGHYTQMIWRDTTQLGVGQATCSGGGAVVAAEYNPPGNYIGQKPY